MLAAASRLARTPQVADISLAEFGRREIEIAENEMPGLMSLRTKYVACIRGTSRVASRVSGVC